MDFFPHDWPVNGPIDLAIHDLQHQSSDIEWWYFNAHMTTNDYRQFGIFASFFIKKIAQSDLRSCYSALWGISDLKYKKFYFASYVDQQTPHLCLENLTMMNQSYDLDMKRALQEFFKKDKIPFSDKVMKKNVFISKNSLKLHFGNLSLEKSPEGYYCLHLKNQRDSINCKLIFQAQKEAVRQGKNGQVLGPNNEQMFYYFIPRCQVRGILNFKNKKLNLTAGQGWYDHEFGINCKKKTDATLEANVGWIWVAIQLNNDFEISLYSLYDLSTKKLKNLFFTIIDPDGQQHFYQDVVFTTKSTWKSLDTFSEYSSAWNLQVKTAELELEIRANFLEQECITILSHPGFWEGSCRVKGLHKKKSVTGKAYIEQTNLKPIRKINDFFVSVSEEVSKEITSLLPLELDFKRIRDLITTEEKTYLMEGIDLRQFVRTMIAPIRTICDRAGKRWRSYALIACCQLVGGDFKKFRQWLAIPELIHTGSLIIDDVQDRSVLRRGGSACHVLFGEPHAINAGTAAYALFYTILKQTKLSAKKRNQVYELYFDTFRAAHAGQAIDIDGHLDVMLENIKMRNFATLKQRILAAHRLKSAVPFASMAKMGAILGQGTNTQIEALGSFFEALGLAFQIIDDVLNIRGFKDNLKTIGEDIYHGKVTYPIAKSLELLDQDESTWMWEVLAKKANNTALQQALIKRLETCGALDVCSEEASSIVDAAWKKLDPLIKNSYTKMMLRAFSWHVINRHY